MATATVNVSELNSNKALDSTNEVSPQAAEASAAVDNKELVVNYVQKKMKRAERFGMLVQLSEEEKRSSRAERFGLTTETVLNEEAKKKSRLERFAATSVVDNVEDDKRKTRTLRFSQPSVTAVPNVNGKGKLVQSETVAGKAGGAA